MEREGLVKYRRFLKRRNYSGHAIKTYVNTLEHLLSWLPRPVAEVTSSQISAYIEFLLAQGLTPKTITCRLDSARTFFTYLRQEEGTFRPKPVQKGSALRLARPLLRFLKMNK
jgi:site-specific recombinase XerD